MKKIFLFSFLIVSAQFTFSQNLAWVKSWGGNIWDNSSSAATDGDGNIFVTGNFRYTMDADPGPAVVNFVSEGGRDIFVSKFNATGVLLWAKQISGTSDEVANGIATDSDGNIYITGTYMSTVDFDPGPGVFNLTPQQVDTYICKLDNDGNFIFAKEFHGGAAAAYGIAVDADQNIYTTGRFNALTDFDPGPGVFALDAFDYTDMFVCKLDVDGEFVWAKQMAESADTASIRSQSIAVDIHGNVYTTGKFYGTVDFDPGTGVFNLASTDAVDNQGSNDAFVCKLDADGNFAWARSLVGGFDEESTGVAVDEDENVYTTGYFVETVDFDPGSGVFEITSSGQGADSFIWKLDEDGHFVWAKSLGGTPILAQGISLAQDNIYTTGYFSGTADFDPGTAIYSVTATGGFDVFVCKLDLDGEFIWAQKSGGIADESAFAIAVDPTTENVYVTGVFSGTTDFDPSAQSWEVVSRGETDAFLLKLGECVPNNGITHVKETCNQYQWSEDGGLYTVSGLYGNTLASSTGCDSTVWLDLTLWNFESEIGMNLFGYLIVYEASEFIDEYKWINCETFEVVGTQGSYHVTVDGSYALITTSGNCVDTSACVDVTVVGLNELEAAGFSLYPNPASDQLTFQSDNALQPFEIEITSINGQLIYSGKHASGDQLSTQKWLTGIYLIKIISGDKSYVTRIVKE